MSTRTDIFEQGLKSHKDIAFPKYGQFIPESLTSIA